MAQLSSSNPAFRHGFVTEQTPTAEQLSQMYRAPSRMTIDDVLIHTLGVFAVLGVTAGLGWAFAPASPGIGFAAGLGALALSFLIAFRRVVSPPLVILFAGLEGVAMGMISRFYEEQFKGIVVQALLGTAVIFVLMLVLYRSHRLRATPRMRRVVYSTLMGVIALGLIDLVLRMTTGSHLPILNSASPIGILFSLAILVVASLQFILDFDYIEKAIAAGAPRSEAWRAAYGLLVGFVWVYLELLRLLGKLRS